MYWNANLREYNDVLYVLSAIKVSGSATCSNAMIIVSPVPCIRMCHEAVYGMLSY